MPFWLNVSFESEVRDECPCLKYEYDGLTLFIRSSLDDCGDIIAAYVPGDTSWWPTLLKINRFLSAMAWRDQKPFRTLGAGGSGTTAGKKNIPEFHYYLPRQSRAPSIGFYYFDGLQNPHAKEQKLALALYREGLNEINPLFSFLSFYKILNLRQRTGREQITWINTNISKLSDTHSALTSQIESVQKRASDLGEYFCYRGRDAIAHASPELPIRDPDEMKDKIEIADDNLILRALAELFIIRELRIPR